ncbi:MAG: hypothetical protein GY756_00145 [bacterium]|nr:hypothetical protein [bacterium]
MMKQITLLISFLISVQISNAQSYFDGKFNIQESTHKGFSYTLYDFSRESGVMRAIFFAQNAYSQYQGWKGNKKILLITEGSFSDSWGATAKPVGLCVDNGVILNRTPEIVMDGLVVICNGGSQIGAIAVVDLDKKAIKCEIGENYEYYHPRESAMDRMKFLEWSANNGLSIFQAHLVYSEKKTSLENSRPLDYGHKRERRFLAICKKNGVVHHVVVDASDALYLNLSAKYAKAVLDKEGYDIMYILNLEPNILHAYDGNDLINLKSKTIEKSSNLLIYYMN